MTRTRLARRTTTLPNGTKVVRTTLTQAPELEWRLQAEIVRQLRAMPEHDALFSVVGDFNAARRSPQEAVKAKATGLTAGEPDIRVAMTSGRMGFIEVKGEKGRLSPAQVERHAVLRRLGFVVEVIKEGNPSVAAARAVALVRGWLAANDNGKVE